MIVTGNYVLFGKPPKEPGWCDQQGIEHSWEDGPTMTVSPPIHTRRCKNCGKSQHLVMEWRDNDRS